MWLHGEDESPVSRSFLSGREGGKARLEKQHLHTHVSPSIRVSFKNLEGLNSSAREPRIPCFFFCGGVLFPLLPATGVRCKWNTRPSVVGLCQSVILPRTSASSPVGEHSRRADVSHQLKHRAEIARRDTTSCCVVCDYSKTRPGVVNCSTVMRARTLPLFFLSV